MSTKSIKDPTDRLATMADVLAVIDAASASIAGLELRIQALEQAARKIGAAIPGSGYTGANGEEV